MNSNIVAILTIAFIAVVVVSNLLLS